MKVAAVAAAVEVNHLLHKVINFVVVQCPLLPADTGNNGEDQLLIQGRQVLPRRGGGG